ncbi:MAG: HAD-IB family phosphatase [Actinobacteria bacterium]|nr:HAD-IB family phosphatase [Actinomycetota bacterium]
MDSIDPIPRIADALHGKRIFITGATGFLGTALVERILHSVDSCQVVLLIRPSSRTSPERRAEREILKNDCFDELRRELGDRFATEALPRVTVVAGDVTHSNLGLDEHGMEMLAGCDIAIHSAAAVAFDSPIDMAVEINLLGPTRVAQAIRDAAPLRRKLIPGSDPTHLISISTAYVAGTHQGEAAEILATEAMARSASSRTSTTVTTEVDIDAEINTARRLRSDLQTASRHPDQLDRFTRVARKELGSAGPHLLAERVERLREEWVKKSLVDAGKVRSQSMGWPDAYAFTKALGERLLVNDYRDIPISIVRPSIIESALARPTPGWIRGFRMAEPIIISYARGLLKEFPGIPEGIIDVIPVDMVVSAIMAVAARGPQGMPPDSAPDSAPATPPDLQPEPALGGRQTSKGHMPTAKTEGAGIGGWTPAVYHVATGSRNPLRYGELVDLVKEWFSATPLYDADGQPIDVPEWSFPGRGRVQAQLKRSIKFLAGLESLIGSIPVHSRGQELAAQLEDQRTRAERALTYAELYGAYTETDAVFLVDNLLSLYNQMHEDDRREYCFDPAAIRWSEYVREIHLPSIVTHARVRTTPSRPRSIPRSERSMKAILSPERQMAVFDLENTLISANVVDSYLWLAMRRQKGVDRLAVASRLALQIPRLWALDRKDRGDFLRTFYRYYEGARIEALREDAMEFFHSFLMARSYPAGFARVRKHRSLGHRTVLVTGSLDFLVEPLRPLFDEILCARLAVSGGQASGGLETPPPTGEARALLLARYARTHDLELSESVAYADSVSDLSLLDAVGFPVAVNADQRLSALAKKRGWHTETWKPATRSTTQTLAIPPSLGGSQLSGRMLSRVLDMLPGEQLSTRGTSEQGNKVMPPGMSRTASAVVHRSAPPL